MEQKMEFLVKCETVNRADESKKPLGTFKTSTKLLGTECSFPKLEI